MHATPPKPTPKPPAHCVTKTPRNRNWGKNHSAQHLVNSQKRVWNLYAKKLAVNISMTEVGIYLHLGRRRRTLQYKHGEVRVDKRATKTQWIQCKCDVRSIRGEPKWLLCSQKWVIHVSQKRRWTLNDIDYWVLSLTLWDTTHSTWFARVGWNG